MDARTEPSDPTRADRRELHQMWLSLMRGSSWSSIVVVPTDADISAAEVIGALVEVAALNEIDPFQIFDAAGATPARGERLAQELASAVAGGWRAVAAIDSPMKSLGGIPLVRDAEAALLIVRLGQSRFDSVQSTIDIVGRARILGAVTLPP